jgi:hypothetical protein
LSLTNEDIEQIYKEEYFFEIKKNNNNKKDIWNEIHDNESSAETNYRSITSHSEITQSLFSLNIN